MTFLAVDSVSGTMNVSLTDKLEDFVNQLVERGRYRSASELVRKGIRLLEIREAQLRSKPEDTKKSTEKPKSSRN